MNALDHWSVSSEEEDDDEFECDRCDRIFSSWEGCKQHMSALNHWFTDICDTCDRRFVNRHALDQHRSALGHRALHRCTKCNCSFQTENDWFKHMTSPIHTRAEPIHSATVSPVGPTPTPRSAPTAARTPIAPVPSTSAVASSPTSSTRPQPSSRPPAPSPSVNSTSARLSVRGHNFTPVSAVVSAQSSTSVLPVIQPRNTGTISTPFLAFIERDNAASIDSHYQSITFMQHYQTFSFEELRLADYRAGRRPIYTNQQTGAFAQHTDVSSSDGTESSFFTAAAGSRTSTPSIINSSNAESHTAESSATTTVHMQENLTALTAEDNVKFHLIHEARSKVMRLVRNNENAAEWVSQGTGPIRILASKDTSSLRMLMRADPSGKVGLDLDVPLDCALYDIKAPKMVQLKVPTEDKQKVEAFMCIFKEEFKAEEFLDKLHKAIAKAQNSSAARSDLSLSEIQVQHTEPVEKPEVVNCPSCQVQHTDPVEGSQIVNCPFCRFGFYAVSEILQHLETTSCRARPDLDRGNIYHYLHRNDTHGHLTKSVSDNHVSVSRDEEFLYHCPNMTGKCQGKLWTSFAVLHAHLESMDCDFNARPDLLQDISGIENWVPTFGSC
ncbi:hypothetical protein KCU92_g4523, partial [Aureobasidium melanogenum]